MKGVAWAVALLSALAAGTLRAEHTYERVEPYVLLEVRADRRTERIRAALERVPDCLQERMNLVGAHVIVMGARAPAAHPLRRQVNRDFMASGWRLLTAPFVRVQGRAYPLDQVAFVRRGGRGALGRSRLFTRWIPLTGRGEETALHEYGHLVSIALAVAADRDFYALWARHSPHPVVDALSPRVEAVKQQEWFARAFAAYYASERSRAELSEEARRYLEKLETDVHEGRYDPRFLEFARLSSGNPYLATARRLGERLLPADMAGALRDRGAWGLGFYGQLWYAIQSEALRERHGGLLDLLQDRRTELVADGAIADGRSVHLRETCGDVSATPICRAVRRHRAPIELWHPCLGPPVEGCLVSFGPDEALLRTNVGAGAFPWIGAERHREIATGALRQPTAPE